MKNIRHSSFTIPFCILHSAFCILISSAAFGQQKVPIKQIIMRRSGGFVYQPLPEWSKVVSLIDRTGGGSEALAAFRREMEEDLRIPSVMGAATNAAFTVELVSGGSLTVDLTAGTATVPVGKTGEETQASLWKAMFALFSANAGLSAKMNFQSQEGMVIGRRAMEASRIAPVRRTTYKVACEEGWAQAPTNDFQRAIFDAARTNQPATASAPVKAAAPAAQ